MKIGILGAGTWGIALAKMLCESSHTVTVWSALPDEITNLSNTHLHPKFPDRTKNRLKIGKGNFCGDNKRKEYIRLKIGFFCEGRIIIGR